MRSFFLALCLLFSLNMTAFADDLSRLRRQADRGDAASQYRMGQFYLGKKLPDYPKLPYAFDAESARSYLILAANQNHRDAMIELGTLGLTNKNTNEAIKWYELANYELGLCQIQTNSDLVPEDMAKIVAACLPALEDPQYSGRKDLFVAEYKLGRAFAEGLGGVAKDVNKAVSFMKLASDHGYLLAHEWLGAYYFEGTNIPQNYDLARTYFDRLNLTASPIYLFYMGRMLEMGVNFPKDQAEAERYYFHAAQRGHDGAKEWIRTHPKVTQESLDLRKTQLLELGQQFPYTQTAADGTTYKVSPIDLNFRRMADFYPTRALSNEVEGSVIIECQFGNDAQIEHCIILQEQPKGYGFAAASRKVISLPLKVDDREGFVIAAKGKWFITRVKWLLN